ncbi:dna polymerase alpha catalytic subunit [Phaffia rhodozyma]|uniref:DNA polymerase n=1 Tax=Phaffia rhodozyma TaxID=264483 RepID=A0A0F7SGR0_PHARH|nr:dna polymerase alpha catalytic subunit [Phaffia rhodozyma]
MSSRQARDAKLADLRAARAGVSRAKQWQASASSNKLYDEVDVEEYDQIVRDRLNENDFIEDDDGSGYIDDGREVWGRSDDDEEADEEDRRERKDAKRAAKIKNKVKAPKQAPRPVPPPSANAYRPVISEAKESGFMANLLSSFAEDVKPTPRPPIPASHMSSRKRKMLSPGTTRSSKGHTPADDERGSLDWESLDAQSAFGEKKIKVEEDIDMEDPEFGMQFMGSPEWGSDQDDDEDPDVTLKDGKVPDLSGDEDDLAVKVRRNVKPDIALGSSTLVNLPAAAANSIPSRKFVNATSVAVKKPNVLRPLPTHIDPDEEPTKPEWLALSESLTTTVVPSSDHQPPSSPAQAEFVPEPKTKGSKASASSAKKTFQTTVEAFEQDGSTLHMFWLDFHEQEVRSDAGTIKHLYLFGKVWDKAALGRQGKWVSCCLKINGLERNLFIAPRRRTFLQGNETDLVPEKNDVKREFDQKRREHGITSFMAKWVKRNYSFGVEGVPSGENDWLKVIYGFDEPALPTNLSGNTFGHVLGTNTSAFEIFVLKRKIMGPCWLEIKNAEISGKGVSWCKLEVTASDPKDIRPLADGDDLKEMPPLTIMSLTARTIVNHKENTREVVCVAARVWNGANIGDPTPPEKQPSSIHTIVRPLGDFPPGFVNKCRSEGSKIVPVKDESLLLNNLLSNISRHDPDVIVGHDFLNVSLEVLLQRMSKHKSPDWSRVGRFKRRGQPPTTNKFTLGLLAGRLVCDLSSDGAKTMIASTTWSLTEMCATQLKINREDIDPDDTHTFFDDAVASPDRLLRFVRHCEADAFFQMAITAKVQILPLTRQLTTLSGNSWNRTLNGGRAERNEFILLHEFHKLKYICPDKFIGKNKAALLKAEAEDGDEAASTVASRRGGKRDKFKGGLVFEPKRGLWDKYVLVMDFNSLYPSIIQEYNIDFTTVSVTTEEDEDGEEKIPEVPSSELGQGVLPRLIAQLVNRRREVKSLMKGKISPMLMMQYDIRQKALKLTANSMYGCLGFEYSRFYARPLAALTTFKGREILTNTKELAESIQLEVVYGDTDSVFVNSNVTDFDEAMKTANLFKKQVNDKYKLLEIDLDGVFQRLLLLQKKKYAAIKVEADGSVSTEVKGLDMKRREFCKLSKDVSQYVLDRILSGEPTEVCINKIHDYLTSVGRNVREDKVDIEDFVINKRLGKNPEDYPDAKNQPQVQVALRMKARGGNARAGDVMQYVFCVGKDDKTARSAQADRAYHPDELRKATDLKLDFDYYLSLQVLPPVERLCESIEGTDRARLAECLGLDPQRFAVKTVGDIERDFYTLGSKVSDKDRFQSALPFEVRCFDCQNVAKFGGLQDDINSHIRSTGIHCSECSKRYALPSLAVQLEIQIRDHISRYYQAVMVCDDQACLASTRAIGVYAKQCLMPNCRGQMHLEYTDAALYNQLLYYKSLFDTDKAVAAVKASDKFEEVQAFAAQNKHTFKTLSAVVQKYLNKNGRGTVEMNQIFSFMTKSSVWGS